MAEPTLYLFDGHNLLHAGSFADQRELTDALASFVALRGARGVLVCDGAGADAQIGALAVRYAPHADACSSDCRRIPGDRGGLPRLLGLRRPGTSGQEVQKRSSRSFLGDLEPPRHPESHGSRLGDSLDAETRARSSGLRRGER